MANCDSLLQQIENKGNNKLMVDNKLDLNISHVDDTLILTCPSPIKLLNVLVVPNRTKSLLSISNFLFQRMFKGTLCYTCKLSLVV